MRVGVTGLSGFTGTYLGAALKDAGHHPIAISPDLTDATALDHAVAEIAPDAVIHLAAKAFVASDDLAEFYTVNQVGSFNLLDAVARHRPGARVVLASSAQVYGEGASGTIAEDHPPAPANHYALSKRAMEMGASFWRDRLSILVARPFNYTGRGQENRYLIPKIVDHFRRRAAVIELGNIDVERDFGDVRAVVQAYVGLLGAADSDVPVNIATAMAHSVRDVLAMAGQLTGHHPEIVVNPAFVRNNDVQRLTGSNERLRTLLPHWAPVPLSDTLEWMLA
ncbi:GDP-mannose 4,6-dehydratase (plasmid) [Sphingomonas sanguinis]|uniref:GDP-mannose 4,6-dehydratase n=1 Tax=Sphingomonas sanguinis TaxID=33051 RepID=UPI001C597AB7|nr:GDP-mannose 4,6-dehydratase [Sphingomonas sanguinis]QXT37998.1 GDP-mannose 4,6-dehydratase [Sphingomonas sanguinis]